jgi:inner membrane protein
MDTLTHVVLGAVTGELVAGNQLGKKAMAWGAIAQVFADIDVIAALWLSPAENVIFHRGITHSILFNLVLGFIGAFAIIKIRKLKASEYSFWAKFLLIQFALHMFVDGFNAYGVGLFEPFIKVKFSLNSLFVVDPLFTISLFLASIILLFEKEMKRRKRWAITAILISGMYLITAVSNHYIISARIASKLETENISYRRLLVTPTPLNSWLWFIAAEQDSGYYLNYSTIFRINSSNPFHYIPKGEQFIPWVNDQKTLRKLTNFSDGYYTIEKKGGDTLVFNDLRFGQIAGWQDPAAPFAFHYYIDGKGDNTYVMQRGRFTHWNSKTVKVLLKKTFDAD